MHRLAPVVLLALAACKSDSKKLTDELDRVSSWKATIATIDTVKARNRVPVRYARDAVADAQSEIAKSLKTIDDLKAHGAKPEK